MSAQIAAGRLGALVTRAPLTIEQRITQLAFWQQFSTDRTPAVQSSREARRG